MATIDITSSVLGNPLQELLMSQGIEPGDDVSYQLCKTIYLHHPLGAKLAELPISIAMSQEREISIPNSPEDTIKEAFCKEWEAIGADKHIFNVMRLSRIYGIASVAYGAMGIPTDRPIDPKDLADLDIYFNILDPLNTAGSLVLNQDPNSPDFQKHSNISVNGIAYHRSRSVTIMNEEPVYIAYSNSAFGFVGRSVYQRTLFPLKSFIQSMITDDLVTLKAGVIVAKTKQAGSIVDRVMQKTMGLKRDFVKEAQTGNVLSIGLEESIEAIDLKNADTGMITARKNILDNIASGAGMPAKMLNNETMAEGFGEGTEDAKKNAEYINSIREEMQPLYDFFDKIVMARAWNPDFHKTIQAQFPEYKKVGYTKAYYEWCNSFHTEWPSLLQEPDSEVAKVDDIKLKAAIAATEVLLPNLDPVNKANLIDWLTLTLNDNKILFKHPLLLDIEALKNYVPPVQPTEPDPPKPFSSAS
jgi:hypothetical protein